MAKLKLTREEFDALPLTAKAGRVAAVGIITAALTAIFAQALTVETSNPAPAPTTQSEVAPSNDL